jgi:hypothetical protein
MRNEERGKRAAHEVSGRSAAPLTSCAALFLKWMLAAGVLASLLFAHGCHGNEDHELFDAIEWVGAE